MSELHFGHLVSTGSDYLAKKYKSACKLHVYSLTAPVANKVQPNIFHALMRPQPIDEPEVSALLEITPLNNVLLIEAEEVPAHRVVESMAN